MRSFIFQIVVYSILLWLLNWGVGSYLRTYETKDLMETGQFFPALRWQEYYEREAPIDLLVLGSSHAYRAYDPKVMGVYLDKKNRIFNLGSAAQSPLISYYILKEVVEKQRPKQVVMDLYFMVFTNDNQLRNRRYNWGYMRPGAAKKAFFRDGFSTEEKVKLTAFPSLVFKDYLKPKINKLLGRPHLLKKKGTYQGAGFVSNSDSLTLEKLTYHNQFDAFQTKRTAITEMNLNYLKKIKDLCASEHIPLIFATAPMPEISVKKIKNYTGFYQLFFKLAEAWNIPYIDYNINRIETLSDTDHFYDDDHLNAAGAQVFSAAVTKELQNILNPKDKK